MKVKNIKCPNCNGSLDLDINNREFIFCPYCGTQVFLDDENKEFTININKNINHTKRIVNEAEILLQQNESAKIQQDVKEIKWSWLLLIGMLVLSLGGLYLGEYIDDKAAEVAIAEGKISAGFHGDYEGENYQAVQKQLEVLGFANIELIDLENAGLFKNKKDTVEMVSIDGRTDFQQSDYFETIAKVIISYH